MEKSITNVKKEVLKNLRLAFCKKRRIEIGVMLYLQMNQVFIFIVHELVDGF